MHRRVHRIAPVARTIRWRDVLGNAIRPCESWGRTPRVEIPPIALACRRVSNGRGAHDNVSTPRYRLWHRRTGSHTVLPHAGRAQETAMQGDGYRHRRGRARHPPGRARLLRDDAARHGDLQRPGGRRGEPTQGLPPPRPHPRHPRAWRPLRRADPDRRSSGENTRLLTNPAVHGMLPDDAAGPAPPPSPTARAPPPTPWQIDAIPAYNTTPDRLQYHPQGRDNGYVLTIGGRRFYIAGDTEDIPGDARARGDRRRLRADEPALHHVDRAGRRRRRRLRARPWSIPTTTGRATSTPSPASSPMPAPPPASPASAWYPG